MVLTGERNKLGAFRERYMILNVINRRIFLINQSTQALEYIAGLQRTGTNRVKSPKVVKLGPVDNRGTVVRIVSSKLPAQAQPHKCYVSPQPKIWRAA